MTTRCARSRLAILIALSCAACSGNATDRMERAIQELMRRPEQPVEAITIQQVLVAFRGAPRIENCTRSQDEAKALAAHVYELAVAGNPFDTLVKQFTNDTPPGILQLRKAGRASTTAGLSDLGFRLAVGEIGVCPFDAVTSPHGWHIVKRLR